MTAQTIYSRGVLDLAGNIPRIGRLRRPDATATVHSRLCGSTVTVDLRMADGIVTDFAQEVSACALGQAAASVVAGNIVGANSTELRALSQMMRRMLTEEGPPPEGRLGGLAALEPARDYKARHPAIMLIFDAIVDVLDQIESGEAVAPPSRDGAADKEQSS